MLYVKKSKRALRLFTALLLPLLFSAVQAHAQTQLAGISFNTDVYDVAVNPSNNRIYVPSGYFFSAQLVVIDGNPTSPTFNQAVAHVSLPSNSYPLDVAANPNTGRVYVTDYSANRVLVVDGATNTYLTSIPLGAQPMKLALNPATNKIYVPIEAGVVVIDGNSDEVVNTIPLAGGYPYAVAANPATNRIYVSILWSNTVAVIDGTNDAVTATVPVGYGPYSIAVNPSTDIIYAANRHDGTISVIQGSSSTVEAVIYAGYNADTVALNEASGRVYVTDSVGGTIAIIDGDKTSDTYHQRLATLSVPTRMYDVAVNSSTNLFYVTTGLLFVFDDPPPTASALIATLIDKLKSYNLAQGVTNSLVAKLESARSALNSSNGNNGSPSCSHLGAFVNEVRAHAGRQEFTPAQADDLTRAAERIRRALGCQ